MQYRLENPTRRNMRILTIVLVALCVCPISFAQSDTSRMKIAVLELEDKGIGGQVVSLLPGVVSKQLSSYGLFDIISREDIRRMLSNEQDKMMLGCDDAGCLAEIGGALGAEAIVTGDVGKIGNKIIINLQRINIRDAKVEMRAERQFEGPPAKLLDEVRIAAHLVVKDLLKQASGDLIVSISEPGADVSLDGNLVGISPVKKLDIPAGPHDIRVKKDGFVTWVRSIKVAPHRTQMLDVTLIPSASFIKKYEDRAQSMRRWAWITAAAFAVFEGSALGLRTYTWQKIDPIANDYNNGDYGDLTQKEYYDKYRDDIRLGDKLDYTALGLGIGGALLGAVSVYLFIEGDNPDRYMRFRDLDNSEKPSESKKTSSLVPDSGSLVPLAGGGTMTFVWKF